MRPLRLVRDKTARHEAINHLTHCDSRVRKDNPSGHRHENDWVGNRSCSYPNTGRDQAPPGQGLQECVEVNFGQR